MCTAVTYKTKDFYFGRTLDYEFSYGDEVTITPRNYLFEFRFAGKVQSHYAMIGMAHVVNNFPLYYDAVNEKGLGIAGLNFVGNAKYCEEKDGKINVAQFEFIPWLLSQCASVQEVRKLLQRVNVTNTPFSNDLPVASLHWIIADEKEAVTVECVEKGMFVYENSVGVLTNNPPFDVQMFNLSNYMGLSPLPAENRFCSNVQLKAYSRGMGAMGLPGDLSSASRFVRVAFTKLNSVCGNSEEESVSQFFHIIGSVEQQRGCCVLDDGKYEITIYTSCCNANKGVYYYTTYENRAITSVDMRNENLEGNKLIRYPLATQPRILCQNAKG